MSLRYLLVFALCMTMCHCYYNEVREYDQPRNFDQAYDYDEGHGYDENRDYDEVRDYNEAREYDHPRDYDQNRNNDQDRDYDETRDYDQARDYDQDRLYEDDMNVYARFVPWQLAGKYHNIYRKRAKNFVISPLKVSFQLTKRAKKCVESMLKNDVSGKGHPCNPRKDGDGENIYTWFFRSNVKKTSDLKTLFEYAVKGWFDEYKYIDFTNPHWWFFLKTDDSKKPVGHFTQVMWKGTKEVGCAIGNSRTKTMVVCRYSPPGNQFTSANIRDNVPEVKEPVIPCEDKDFCKHLSCTGSFAKLARENCRKKCKEC